MNNSFSHERECFCCWSCILLKEPDYHIFKVIIGPLPLNNKNSFRDCSLLIDDLEKCQRGKKEAAAIANAWQRKE